MSDSAQPVGRDLQIFNSLKANMADYLLLDGELCANVQGNLMDEMLITIIQGTLSDSG